MVLPPVSSDRTLYIYLSLAQYPILSTHIRSRMRGELFHRGITTPSTFEAEARERAIRSQMMEGLRDPLLEEPTDIWEMRLTRVRDHLTDFYFAHNLPYDLFEEIVRDTLVERGADFGDLRLSFNPELAPQNMLFDQAMMIEKMSPEIRTQHEARLQEIKVVLIRTLISDQLGYLKIAKDWFTISDLAEIRSRKIGQGKIGGKAAGMLLAARILNQEGDQEIRSSICLPESYFLGADLTYIFMALNGLMYWNDQKYKLEEQIRAEYPRLQQEFLVGELPNDILEKLNELLNSIGRKPLIVRSSSLLEDNFGASFAGKYESYFSPNQGTPTENLQALSRAIVRIYASIFNPDALMYRRMKGLQDYDERMAILIQEVQGDQYGRFYLPHAAGVAFSRNLYRWSPQIRREDGFLRLVWGLGTRAVDRVGNDYPRMVALSHPLQYPMSSTQAIRRYSQQYVDLIDLEDNAYKTSLIGEALDPDYPVLRYLVQADKGDYLATLRTKLDEGDTRKLVFTFDELLRRTQLAKRFKKMLHILEKNYQAPVDIEFTIQIVDPESTKPDIRISLLQCRPQSHLEESKVQLPQDLLQEDIVFSTHRMAPQGRVSNINYVMFVSPEDYYSLPMPTARAQVGRNIGRLNAILQNETFICLGPGRWGTSNPDLGINIGYADIYHTRALVEITGRGIGLEPEASFGTHFFQDLVESDIYPLAIYLDDEDVIFNREFFYSTSNSITKFMPDQKNLVDCLRIIEVADFRHGHHLELVMDDEAGRSVAYLERNR